jgi:uridine kinase
MHLPLTSLVMGEAAGEGDFGVRLVDHHFGENGNEHSQNGSHSCHRADTGTQSKSEKNAQEQGEDADDQGDGIPLDLQENALEGFKSKSTTIGQRSTEELKFSRRHRESTTSGEKRVWVVSPGEWMILIPVGREDFGTTFQGPKSILHGSRFNDVVVRADLQVWVT